MRQAGCTRTDQTKGMDKERFDFLTYEQLKRLSQKEKVAYLERATVELEGCGRLTLARLSNLSPIHARSSRVDAKSNEETLPLTVPVSR